MVKIGPEVLTYKFNCRYSPLAEPNNEVGSNLTVLHHFDLHIVHTLHRMHN